MKESLYDSVKDLPIIDYHNHLSFSDIMENTRFKNIFELWIKPDPYKHRAMRMCGVKEKYITGDASLIDKFKAWCNIFPMLIGNPLYVWSKNELEKVFKITEIPNKDNAEQIYNKANLYLEENEITTKTLLDIFNVEFACPCAGFTDDIECLKDNKRFSPSLRGDDATSLSLDFIKRLETITKTKINTLEELQSALKIRLDAFENMGCKFSDHAIDNGFCYYYDDGKNNMRFERLLNGELKDNDKQKLSSYILTFLGAEYAKRNFVMQLHIGAQRHTSSRLRKLAGPAGGFAGIGNSVDVNSLISLLNTLDMTEYGLPKTVLFTLNPADNALISVLSGSFSKDNVPGLITQGPAWWWCDHKLGICDVLENTAVFGLLSNFIGMTTDSRSFLSFSRHDYFRRILCEFLEEKFEKNELMCPYEDLKKLAYKMCYENAKEIIGG